MPDPPKPKRAAPPPPVHETDYSNPFDPTRLAPPPPVLETGYSDYSKLLKVVLINIWNYCKFSFSNELIFNRIKIKIN